MSDHATKHPFHMVNPSPWPAMGAFSALVLAVGAITYFHKTPILGMENLGIFKLVPGFFLVLLTMALWWRDVIRESVVEHAHTPEAAHGLRFGMVLFIASEVMFFAAFFWAFFHNALGFSTSTHQWPPQGIHVLDAWQIPFYNTVILLTSGGTVTLGGTVHGTAGATVELPPISVHLAAEARPPLRDVPPLPTAPRRTGRGCATGGTTGWTRSPMPAPPAMATRSPAKACCSIPMRRRTIRRPRPAITIAAR